jgi:osmoprotectant transport system ATP-binding protein
LDTTIIFVTHDMGEALRLADRLAVIHEGVLLQVGTPTEILAEPANDFVASFFADDAKQRHFLTQVVAAGFGHPAQGNEVVLPAAATIYDWAARLREQPDLLVASGGTALRPADLIGFMATLNGEAGQ